LSGEIVCVELPTIRGLASFSPIYVVDKSVIAVTP
jgi:hypothetical protein